jgi:hypothetical protein
LGEHNFAQTSDVFLPDFALSLSSRFRGKETFMSFHPFAGFGLMDTR